jgi:hypothetical protein
MIDMAEKTNMISIKEYFDAKLDALEKSICLSRDTLNARLENMNEFRESLKDQTASFFTRKEHDFYAEKIESQLKSLELSRAILEGKASQKTMNVTLMLSIISIIIGVIALIVRSL